MPNLIVVTIFVVSVAAGWGYAQEMPPEVKAFLDNYTTDSTAQWGPLRFKKEGAIPDSIPIKDLRLRVLQEYVFRNDINLDAYPNTVALSEVIAPSDRWRVAVTAHDKAFCEFILAYINGKPRVVRSTSGRADMSRHSTWGPLLKAYPESTGINPVSVVLYRFCCSPIERYFLYFKQLGPRKIYYCNKGHFSSELDSLFPSSIETLDDSKKLMKYKKEIDIKYKTERARLEKARNDDKPEPPKIFSYPALYREPSIKLEEIEVNSKDLLPAEACAEKIRAA